MDKSSKRKRVLFITPYPRGYAPSQRFRFEQYYNILFERHFETRIQSYLTLNNWRQFYSRGNLLQKIITLADGLGKRILILAVVPSYDYIFVHREATPGGPPIFEWLVAKVFKKKVIYDFDDAIWLTDKLNETKLETIIRSRNKVKLICEWSYKLSCGNKYLAGYGSQFNSNVVINPTTIDTERLHNPILYDKVELKRKDNVSGLVIGWTGSHSTLKYFEALFPVLQLIENKYPEILFLVIANQIPKVGLTNLLFKQWSEETEIADLMLMDIGIMPLPDDEWTKGKCGFKILQYMALSIPSVASAVGVNSQIIQHGVNGYLCATEDEWVTYLTMLINDATLRRQMGEEGRNTVIERYSVISNSENFLRLFE